MTPPDCVLGGWSTWGGVRGSILKMEILIRPMDGAALRARAGIPFSLAIVIGHELGHWYGTELGWRTGSSAHGVCCGDPPRGDVGYPGCASYWETLVRQDPGLRIGFRTGAGLAHVIRGEP